MTTTSLTIRQQQVCELAIQGLSHKQIARKLEISYRTVEDHIYHAYKFYGVNNKVGLLYKIMEVSRGAN